MEQVSDLLKTVSLTINREAKRNETALDPHVVEVINRLFVFFRTICRGFEKQYYETKLLNAEKTQWIRAFMDLGFNSLEKVKLGIKKCRLQSPINTPTIGQFVEWCTPTAEEIGTPGVENAYEEACRNSSPYNRDKIWSHQAVYHAYSMCNSFDLTNLPKKNTFPIFEHNYKRTLQMINRGEELKEIPPALTYDSDFHKKEKVSHGFGECKNRSDAMKKMFQILGKKYDASDQG
jgi:hypothetical protein